MYIVLDDFLSLYMLEEIYPMVGQILGHYILKEILGILSLMKPCK
jgi:hypothetical protein